MPGKTDTTTDSGRPTLLIEDNMENGSTPMNSKTSNNISSDVPKENGVNTDGGIDRDKPRARFSSQIVDEDSKHASSLMPPAAALPPTPPTNRANSSKDNVPLGLRIFTDPKTDGSLYSESETLLADNLIDKEKHGKELCAKQTRFDDASFTDKDDTENGSIASNAGSFTEALPTMKARMLRRMNKTSENYCLKVVVGVLFLIIIIGCTVLWIFHPNTSLEVDIGRIRFNERSRILELLNNFDEVALQGHLGMNIPDTDVPFDCGNDTRHVCLEWRNYARLGIILQDQGLSRCYNIEWQALDERTSPKDCFSLHSAHWYGVGEVSKQTWPAESWSIPETAFITGDASSYPFGSILERYWLSSAGTSLYVNRDTPLFVSMATVGQYSLCFSSRRESYHDFKNQPVRMKYTICSSSSIQSMHSLAMKKYLSRPKGTPGKQLIEKPIWTTSSLQYLTQNKILEFAEKILMSKLDSGTLIIGEGWENKFGDFRDLAASRFPSAEKMFSILQKNVNTSLQVSPYINVDSYSFVECVESGLLVEHEAEHAPALKNWKMGVGGALDMTHNESQIWFVTKLKVLSTRYNLSGFTLSGGQSSHLPVDSKFAQNDSPNPDTFAHQYVNMAAHWLENLTYVSTGAATQSLPFFVRISPRRSDWSYTKGLASVIPTVMSVGLVGYPFVHAGAIGGEKGKPGRELYLRWLQLSAFLPVMEFSTPPWEYDDEMVELSQRYIKFHQKVVVPLILELASEAEKTGAPIIRPLWWIAANDETALLVDSEFLIGGELLVAPIIEPRRNMRDIYLPDGLWYDMINEKEEQGKKWLRDFPVDIDEVAHFRRISSAAVNIARLMSRA